MDLLRCLAVFTLCRFMGEDLPGFRAATMNRRASIPELREMLRCRLEAASPRLGTLFFDLQRFAPSLEEGETVRRFTELFEEHPALRSQLILSGSI